MNVTDYLLQKDRSLGLHSEAEWGGLSSDTLASKYVAFNSGGIECEVGEFLYGLVRMLKPMRVLETGSHLGIGAAYIGQALKDSGFGKLTTIEYLQEIHNIATKRISDLGLGGYVELLFMDSRSYQTNDKFDLILLDTEPQFRFLELTKFYDNLNEGGYIFIHDLHRHMSQVQVPNLGFGWPFGALPQEIKKWVQEDKLRPFHFSTSRGLTGFYKVKKEDYKWQAE